MSREYKTAHAVLYGSLNEDELSTFPTDKYANDFTPCKRVLVARQGVRKQNHQTIPHTSKGRWMCDSTIQMTSPRKPRISLCRPLSYASSRDQMTWWPDGLMKCTIPTEAAASPWRDAPVWLSHFQDPQCSGYSFAGTSLHLIFLLRSQWATMTTILPAPVWRRHSIPRGGHSYKTAGAVLYDACPSSILDTLSW